MTDIDPRGVVQVLGDVKKSLDELQARFPNTWAEVVLSIVGVKLNQTQRIALLLSVHPEGLTASEISTRLKIKEESVRSLINGRKELFGAFQKNGQEKRCYVFRHRVVPKLDPALVGCQQDASLDAELFDLESNSGGMEADKDSGTGCRG